MRYILKKYYGYLIVILAYYVMPSLFVRDTGSAINFFLLIIPALVFVVSMAVADENGFKWYFSIVVGILWLPNILILNSSAAIYAAIYGAISFAGQIIGFLINRKK